MALPLPQVVPDVGSGGPLVTAMGGINALNNNMLLRKINEAKAQYAPLTTQAEALSKMAYANAVMPQSLIKLMSNPDFVANMTDDQAKAMADLIRRGGMGQGNANQLLQMGSPQGMSGQNMLSGNQGIGQQLGNKFSNFLTNSLQNVFSRSNQQGMGQGDASTENVLRGIAHVESEGAKNPYQLIGKDTGKGDHALGKYQVLSSNVPEWTKEALGQSMTPYDFLNSPEAQEKVAAYMVEKYKKQGMSPQDIGSMWFTGKPLAKAGNVHDSYGTTPQQYVTKMAEGMDKEPEKTYAEKAAEFQGIKEEGKQAGKIRAESQKELDQEYQQALQLKGPFTTLNKVISNPVFQNLRNIPGFQQLQLDTKANIGNKEEQDLIGQFQAASRAVVANTIKGFGGRILASEIPLSESMKISPKDTIGVMLGKAPVIEAFNEMTLQRSRLASQIMEKEHISKGAALEKADKMIDGEAIRNQIAKELQTKEPSESDMKIMMQKYNLPREEIIKRLKALGKL